MNSAPNFHTEHTLSEVRMSDEQDTRKGTMIKPDGDLDTAAYKALKLADTTPNAWAKFIWKNKAPPRVKFFGWLLSQSRIQCKANLVKKRLVETDACEICNAGPEDTAHIIFGCTNTQRFWSTEALQLKQTGQSRC